jgi:hypothetical protein
MKKGRPTKLNSMPCGQIYLQNSDSAEYYPEDSAGRTYIDHICLKNNYNYYSASSSEIIQGYNNILKLGRIGGSHTPTPVRIFSPHFSALPARKPPNIYESWHCLSEREGCINDLLIVSNRLRCKTCFLKLVTGRKVKK